jgi:hypothetical protein
VSISPSTRPTAGAVTFAAPLVHSAFAMSARAPPGRCSAATTASTPQAPLTTVVPAGEPVALEKSAVRVPRTGQRVSSTATEAARTLKRQPATAAHAGDDVRAQTPAPRVVVYALALDASRSPAPRPPSAAAARASTLSPTRVTVGAAAPPCLTGTSRITGACRCDATLATCADVEGCFDLRTSQSNCGSRCPTGTTCTAGRVCA